MCLLPNQRSLSDMCRLCIRKHVTGPNMLCALQRINYPEKLRRYLMFSTEDYVTLLCEPPITDEKEETT